MRLVITLLTDILQTEAAALVRLGLEALIAFGRILIATYLT